MRTADASHPSSPLVSIILPVRNGERFIEHAIASVAAQDYPHLELIVVDGASTDRTISILATSAKAHPFLRYISEPDAGQSDAMNKGLKLAHGEIVSFLNADDYYETDAISSAIRVMKGLPSPALVVGNCKIHNLVDGSVYVDRPKHLGLENFVVGRHMHPVNPTQYFYSRTIHDMIGTFPVDEHLAMDLWFYLEVCIRPEIRMHYVDQLWGNFRVYAGTKTYDNRANAGRLVGDFRGRYRKHIRPMKAIAPFMRRLARGAKRLMNLK